MRILALLSVLALVVRPLPAQEVFPAPENGEARSRSYHVIHYKIEVSFDEKQKSVRGKVTTTLTPFLPEFKAIAFDAGEMSVTRVTLVRPARDLHFDVLPTLLTIRLDRTYTLGDTITVAIEYSCTPRKGLYFTQPDSCSPDKPWQIWSQGEDMDNHFWFPCYDFPDDRATSEVFGTVRSNDVLLSNGRLAGVTEDKKKGTKTFHWIEGKPHVSYLIMIAAGEYAVLKGSVGKLPLEYYVYPRDTADARICFAQTPDMVRYFSTAIGVPYPWEKYAQVLIADFIEGGMENTSATSLMDVATVFNARARLDHSPTGLIAHELAHQWWGDLVTCKDWRQIWLNESFASYFDPLYHEHWLGKDEFNYMMEHEREVAINTDAAHGRKPIVSVEPHIGDIYSRGATVLHMLRFVLGDQMFWRAIHHYIVKHQFSCVETNDLKEAIEESTGQNLSWFFDEWVYKAGYPVFDVSYDWRDSSRTLSLAVHQTQNMDSLTGVFRMPVDVGVISAGEDTTYRINILSKDTTFILPASRKPDLVLFDRGNWLLKKVNFKKGREEWAYQAAKAGNPLDRITALEELAALPRTGEFVPLFAHAATRDPFWGVRQRALSLSGLLDTPADSLSAQMKSAILEALKDKKADVRAAAVNQLGRFRGSDAIAALNNALHDSSYSVLAGALRSLAQSDSSHAVPALLAYLDTASPRGIVSSTVLSTLGNLDSTKAMDAAFTRVNCGWPPFTRFAALHVLRRFGTGNDRIPGLLAGMLNEKNRFLRAAIIRMLADFGRPDVIPALRKIAEDKDDSAAKEARESMERIEKRAAPKAE